MSNVIIIYCDSVNLFAEIGTGLQSKEKRKYLQENNNNGKHRITN
jgi:hypothetical protein